MDEPSRGPRTIEVGELSAQCWEWPQAAGPSLFWLRPTAYVELARTCAGGVVATDDLRSSADLAEAGMPLVRHVHVLAADPRVVAATPVRTDLRLAPFEEASLEQMAAVRIAAFPPGHPDHADDTDEHRVEAYARELADPANPFHPASRSAWRGDELVGTCLVMDSRHFPGYVGPWVQSVARLPGPEQRGVGAAMLVAVAEQLAGSYVGLAVTDSNPARRLYERMGWSGPQFWLHHVPEVGL